MLDRAVLACLTLDLVFMVVDLLGEHWPASADALDGLMSHANGDSRTAQSTFHHEREWLVEWRPAATLECPNSLLDRRAFVHSL